MKREKFFVKLRFVFLLLLLPLTAMAQQNGSLTGKVTNENGDAVDVANVIIKEFQFRAVSDSHGLFELKRIPAGSYTLVVTCIGYENNEQKVDIQSGENHVAITLHVKTGELEAVQINGRRSLKTSEYVAKLPMKDIENPQVYHVVGKELMDVQQVNNLEDALGNATGLSVVFPATGRGTDGGTYYTLRGFTTQANLINGVAGAVFSNPDGLNIERVEVLKGPSATLYGSALTSFGGAINVVTKKPFEEFGGNVTASAGSWELQRIMADINTPLNANKSLLLRINTGYHSQNTWQDYGFTKRKSFSPSLTYKAGDKLTFMFDASLSEVKATLPPWFYADSATTGVTSVDKVKIDYNRYYFPGDLYPTTQTSNFNTQVVYDINANWKSQTFLSSSNNTSSGPTTYLWFVSDTTAARYDQNLEGTTNMLNFQQNFTGEFTWLNMRHRFVGGADFYRNVTNSRCAIYTDLSDVVNTVGEASNYLDFNASKYQKSSFFYYDSYTGKAIDNKYGAYVSDVIDITPALILNLALRYDYYVNEGFYHPNTGKTTGDYNQGAWSPKAGLVYQIVKNQVSLFANYQNGFKNQLGTDYNGKTFKPQQANQVEGGVKFDMFANRLNATLSYYNIEVTNSIRNDVNHPLYNIQDGTQVSKGIEADVDYNSGKGFIVNAGYSYNHNEFTKSSSDVEGRRPVSAGPEKMAHFWVSYEQPQGSLQGVGVGFGGNFSGEKYMNNDTYSGIFKAPAYEVFKGGVYYDQPRYRVALNANNLFNEKYWIGWASFTPQAPREIILSCSLKF